MALPDEFRVEWNVTPEGMDSYWAAGWRHFGPWFFRRNVMEYGGSFLTVQPLRIVLAEFRPSKSQRRVLRRNLDVTCRIARTSLDDDLRRLFAVHARRFTTNVPPDLESFLGPAPGWVPCENITVAVFLNQRLIAASFLDLGKEGVSSLYAVFDPAESRRSLGTFTMLKEIEIGLKRGCRFYYPGYACVEPSPYDYKKQFAATERYDWRGGWSRLLK